MDERFAEAIRRADYKSMDSLARALKEQAPEAFEGISPRSLAVKLGQLGRGTSTWWRGRPDCVEALDALTGFDAGELIAALEQRSLGRWSFPEFSTLAPLDLLEELPADLGSAHPADPKAFAEHFEGWMQRALPPKRLSSRLYALDGVAWLTVPPGCGRGLLLARLQAVGSVDVVSADTLEDAVAMGTGGRPIVLAPRRAVKHDDLNALMQWDPDRPVLIVSASACPRLKPRLERRAWHPRWDWLVTKSSERRRLDLVSGDHGGVYAHGDEMRLFEWRLAPDWRLRLIAWLEQRLGATGDTLFSRQGLDGWLKRFDPTSVWFSTPTEVVALASLCHASGERKLPSPDSEVAGARLLHHLAPMDSRHESLLLRLVEVRWRDAAHEWLSPLPWSEWLALVEAESFNVVDGERAKLRRKRPQLLNLEVLRQEGFLTVDSHGWWEFAHPTQARLVLRDALVRWVSEGDLERWARPLLGDSSRQAAVDSVLASMSPVALGGSIRAVLRAATGSLSALSAAEALFVTLGCKFAADQADYAPEFAGLLERILQLHSGAHAEVWPPFTRSVGESFGTPLLWLLACWEWSLCSPPPNSLPPELLAWFPGWFPRGNDMGVDWYIQLPHNLLSVSESFDDVRLGFDEAVRSAQRVIDRVGCQGLVEASERGPLWAALMLVAAGRGQVEPQGFWWDLLLSLREAPFHLVRSLEHDDADAVAAHLLPSFLDAANNSASSTFAVLGPIWTWLFGRSLASNVLPRLPVRTVFVLYRRFRGLPPTWQRALEDRLGPDDPEWCWEAALTESVNPEALADRLLPIAPLSIPLLALLWRVAPAQCLAHACDPQQLSSSLLISLCPTELSGRLAETIALREDLMPQRAERLGWVLRRLRESRGQEARLRVLLSWLKLS